jgi:N-acetylglucosaminyl-diphospho-decaprenol L-rhamnosyltransferase
VRDVVSGTVAVVIVSFQTRERTLACVESALSHGGGARVVLVDNASGDGTVDAVRGRFGGRVDIVANTRNVGFGVACNQGASRVADAAWLLFLNADTALLPEALATLIAEGEARADAAVLGPRLVGDDGARRSSVRGHPTRLALLHQHTALRFLRVGVAAYERYKAPPGALSEAPVDVEVVMGAALLVRGDDFRALGGFDERYFLYFEEADLCRRAAQAGRRVRFVPTAVVRHSGGASADHDRERALTWYLTSLFQYVDRFDGDGAGLVYRLVFKPLFLVRLVTDFVRDAAGFLFRRPGKAAELRLAARFVRRGLWEVLLA